MHFTVNLNTLKIRLGTLSTDKIPSVLYCEKLLVQAFQAICNCQSAFGSRKFVNLLRTHWNRTGKEFKNMLLRSALARFETH